MLWSSCLSWFCHRSCTQITSTRAVMSVCLHASLLVRLIVDCLFTLLFVVLLRGLAQRRVMWSLISFHTMTLFLMLPTPVQNCNSHLPDNPALFRTMKALFKTMLHLRATMDDKTAPLLSIHVFLWDRYREVGVVQVVPPRLELIAWMPTSSSDFRQV